MKCKLLICFILIFFISLSASAESIYSLINQGKLKEAANSLSKVSTAALRNGNYLFFQSLLEENGDEAARKMEIALNTSVSPIYLEIIYNRLAHYYFIKKDYQKLRLIVNEYRTKWENGKYSDNMLRFGIILEQTDKNYEAALKQADRYLLYFSKGDENQIGMVDKARVMLAYDKKLGADKILKSISKYKSGMGVPQALYLRAEQAVKENRSDDAVFLYNMLKEGYPSAIGCEALINSMMDMSMSERNDNKAEKMTGTFYSVKVGVFSNKENAKKQSDIFKPYNYNIDIESKTISNKDYYVVYLGRFNSFAEASLFKNKLEINHNDVYQVIAR